MSLFGAVSTKPKFKQDGIALFNVEDGGKRYQVAVFDTDKFQVTNEMPPMQWEMG